MGGKDFTLDPVTLDLVPSDDGWFEMDSTAVAAVVYQLEHEKDAWDGDPDAGSLVKKALELGATVDAQQYVLVETERALGVLAADDLISDVQVKSEASQFGRLVARTSFRDNSTGDRLAGVVDPFRAGG